MLRRHKFSVLHWPVFPPAAVLVGGAARDLLRGAVPKDYDWAAPDPAAAARLIAANPFVESSIAANPADTNSAATNSVASKRGAAFALDEQRQYWRAVVDGVQHDFVPLPADLESELLRRDFTVNALAIYENGQVSDPTGGLRDLGRRSLRMVSEQNLRGDPLRLLRAARLATTLGFGLEAQTKAAVQRLARDPALPLPAAERIGAELNALMLSAEAAAGMLLLRELGLLELYLPELLEGAGLIQGGFHHLDVLDHNIEALHQLLARFPGADLALRWATLLHDIGKPRTKGVHPETGRSTYYGHAELGANLAARRLERLKQPRALVERVRALIHAHMVHLPANEREARRFVHRRRDVLPDLLWLMLADREASRGPQSTPATRHAYQLGFERILAALEEQPPAPAPLLTGREIMKLLNLEAGPVVGRAVRTLAEAAALGDVATPDEARAFLLAHLAACAPADVPNG
ncbi:HDIG domain-containing protein [Deinococcus detaillensis]|uniref:HDIG domain-containing protein n=1 Tax=Deinococcus detaillensis TaxID=2592048 RepID=A0A553V1R9_9DEIO|nr:HDIG domain-containing metalloprotein [Deinococcus detaillensis]TSA86171.1 HDIG domain-containing protein [Deinococcus detaillensis]